jgi:hypothetical protein
MHVFSRSQRESLNIIHLGFLGSIQLQLVSDFTRFSPKAIANEVKY